MGPKAVLATVVAVALLAACSGRDGAAETEEATATAGASSSAGSFGTLKNVCGPGDASSSPTTGVTGKEIKIATFSDVGFTKNQEFVDAADVFSQWCNAAGGINGRKITVDLRDSKLFEVRQRMIQSCREDFAVVGGGAAFDSLGVKDRLKCGLPAFPAQIVETPNIGSDLQVSLTGGASYYRYAGWFDYLLKKTYPQSAQNIGLLVGDAPSIKVLGQEAVEAVAANGGKVIYNDVYPPIGVTDWTPYAQAIKSKGVKGLIYYGDFTGLAKLEQALTTIGYTPDWIDPNSNAYNSQFLGLAGEAALKTQNNITDLGGIAPLEKAGQNPATQLARDLYQEYAPSSTLTFPGLSALSSWLLFAKSAAACGDELTRTCVYENAKKETAWTGGGLQAPVDLSADAPLKCFNVEKATPTGWTTAPGFKPDTDGLYQCNGVPELKLAAEFVNPVKLSDVGKSMSDVK